MSQELIKIAIYTEHCNQAGRVVIPTPEHESGDWDFHKGTAGELRQEAEWYRSESELAMGGHGLYLARVATSLETA